MSCYKFSIALAVLLFTLGSWLTKGHAETPDLPTKYEHQLAYNNPGLAVDLAVGLKSNPLPFDLDQDGDNDLLVECKKEIYFFENDGSGVMKKGRYLGQGANGLTISYLEDSVRVCRRDTLYDEFFTHLIGKPISIPYKPDFPVNPAKPVPWKFADYDGDGVYDLIIATTDAKDFSPDEVFKQNYDHMGEWQGQIEFIGYVYWVKNLGTNKNPKYGKSQQLQIRAGESPLMFLYPSPNLVDLDGDGDLDLVSGEQHGRIIYFENIGSRTIPIYDYGCYLRSDGKIIRVESNLASAVVLDWDKDGDLDIVTGDESGRVGYVENMGNGKGREPRLKPLRYFKQRADKVKSGTLATPCSIDWDGDGDDDLICGNAGGYMSLIENLGGYPPKWAAPRYLSAGRKVIQIVAGPNLSIQGPQEARWGYTVPFAADWDMDGLPDIVTNSIIGKIVWYRNIGSRQVPRLATAQPVEVEWEGPPPKPMWNWWNPESRELVIQWRSRPVVIDLNKDGLNDLVLLDHEGYLSLFERRKISGKLVLMPGKRIFKVEDASYTVNTQHDHLMKDINEDGINDLNMRDPDGALLYHHRMTHLRKNRDEHGHRPYLMLSVNNIFNTREEVDRFLPAPRNEANLLRLNAGWAGMSGRRKFDLVDWDGDGDLDLLINSDHDNTPKPTCIDFLENIGIDGNFLFRGKGPLVQENLGSHTNCPIAVDWNKDGVPDLLAGAQCGYLYYYPRESFKDMTGGEWKLETEKLPPVPE